MSDSKLKKPPGRAAKSTDFALWTPCSRYIQHETRVGIRSCRVILASVSMFAHHRMRTSTHSSLLTLTLLLPPLTPSPSRSITHGHAHPGRPQIRPRRRPVLHGECYCLLFHVCSIFGCAPLVPTHAHAPDHPPSLPSPSPSRACARIRPHSRSPLQGGSPPIKTMTTAGRLRHFPARLRSLLLTLFPEGRGASAVSPVDDD